MSSQSDPFSDILKEAVFLDLDEEIRVRRDGSPKFRPIKLSAHAVRELTKEFLDTEISDEKAEELFQGMDDTWEIVLQHAALIVVHQVRRKLGLPVTAIVRR